jgi:quinol monooxygenase YgiN
MVKVIIERRVRLGEDPAALLRELRAAATRVDGYISGETLVSLDHGSIVTISSWTSLEAWEKWAVSETRADLYKLIAPYLEEEPIVNVYRIMATEPAMR